MKIICDKDGLAKGLNVVLKAIPARSLQPILTCVLINAGSVIKLTGNNLELGIETEVTGFIEESGKIAVDAKLFSEIVRKLPDGDIEIRSDDSFQAVITGGKSKYRIPGMDPAEFSALPIAGRENKIIVPQAVLQGMIRQTSFSIATGNANKLMTGELFEVRNGFFSLTSLEGHRVSIRNFKLESSAEDQKAIVPGETVMELMKILSTDADETVDIYFGGNLILFEFDGVIVVSRLIAGKYFRVDQMVPNGYETKVSIDRQKFINVLERSIPLINEETKVPVIETITDGLMTFYVKSQIGIMNDEVEADKEGKDLKIGFNPKFLLDALKAIDDKTVNMYYTSAKSPCMIRDGAGSYVYIVLPVNFVDG